MEQLGSCQKNPQVNIEMESLQKTCEELSATVDVLLSRLNSVLTPAVASISAEKCAPERSIVQLAAGIRDRRMSIGSVITTVNSAIGRLEL